jgi:hypothetical protein
MMPDIMILTISIDGVVIEPKYVEFTIAEMSSIGFIFSSIGNFWTYVITSPYYLYKSIRTKYINYQKSFYAEAFQQFKLEQENLRSTERLSHQQELDKLVQQITTLQNDNKQLIVANQRMINNAQAFEEDAARAKTRILELESDLALIKDRLVITENNYSQVIREQDLLIKDLNKYKEMLAELGIELSNRDKTIQELGLQKNQLLAENNQYKKDIEEQLKQHKSEKIKLLAQFKKEEVTSKQTYNAYLTKVDELQILLDQHQKTNKTLNDLRRKYSKLEEIVNSTEFKTISNIINSHITLNRVFKQLKDKQQRLEELNAQLFLKWDTINQKQKELISNKSTNKEKLDMIKHYQDELTKYSMLLDIPKLSDTDKSKYLAEINGATRNISDRKESLKDYYTRQEELKSDIQSNYLDINKLLKEFNILCIDITKHNKEFEDEIVKTFPELFKVGSKSGSTTTIDSSSSSSSVIDYPLSRSNSDPNPKTKLQEAFQKKEELQRKHSSEIPPEHISSSRTPLISDDAVIKYHTILEGHQTRKVSESTTQVLPTKRLSSKNLEAIKHKVETVENSNAPGPQITIHKSNPQIRNLAGSIDSSSTVELAISTTTSTVNKSDTNILSFD